MNIMLFVVCTADQSPSTVWKGVKFGLQATRDVTGPCLSLFNYFKIKQNCFLMDGINSSIYLSNLMFLKLFCCLKSFTNNTLRSTPWFRYHISMSLISICLHKKLKSKILAFSDFEFASCAQPYMYCKCPLTSMLSYPIINHAIGTSAKINKSLQFCSRISYKFSSKLCQMIQNIKQYNIICIERIPNV